VRPGGGPGLGPENLWKNRCPDPGRGASPGAPVSEKKPYDNRGESRGLFPTPILAFGEKPAFYLEKNPFEVKLNSTCGKLSRLVCGTKGRNWGLRRPQNSEFFHQASRFRIGCWQAFRCFQKKCGGVGFAKGSTGGEKRAQTQKTAGNKTRDGACHHRIVGGLLGGLLPGSSRLRVGGGKEKIGGRGWLRAKYSLTNLQRGPCRCAGS